MAPIAWTLLLSPGTARTLGFLAVLVGALYTYWDNRRHPRPLVPWAQAAAVLSVGGLLVHLLLIPERLPLQLIDDQIQVVVPIRWWGLMTVLGMVSCFWLQRHFGKRTGLLSEDVWSLWVYGGLTALVGSRLMHVGVNWRSYAADPVSALYFWDGGVAYLGGVIAALLFALVYLRGRPNLLATLDALTLGIALTHGLGRIGCFLAGCCYGRPTDLPWGVSFPVGSIAQYTWSELQHRIPAHEPTPPLHPTQLYEAILGFFIGGLLLVAYRKGARPGSILAGYLLAYPLVRFILEMVRDDPEREFLFRFPAEAPVLLSTSQTTSLILVPVAVWLLLRFKRQTPRDDRSSKA